MKNIHRFTLQKKFSKYKFEMDASSLSVVNGMVDKSVQVDERKSLFKHLITPSVFFLLSNVTMVVIIFAIGTMITIAEECYIDYQLEKQNSTGGAKLNDSEDGQIGVLDLGKLSCLIDLGAIGLTLIGFAITSFITLRIYMQEMTLDEENFDFLPIHKKEKVGRGAPPYSMITV